jgi:hypothetical protein
VHSLAADHEDVGITLRGQADENLGGVTLVNERAAGDPLAFQILHGTSEGLAHARRRAESPLEFGGSAFPVHRPPGILERADQHQLRVEAPRDLGSHPDPSAAVADPSVPAATVEIIVVPGVPSLRRDRRHPSGEAAGRT